MIWLRFPCFAALLMSGAIAVAADSPPDAGKVFRVTLPAAKEPLPTPLPDDDATPGFRIRGTKGWNWTPEQYLAEIPVLAKYKMNFLMNCYLSMFDTSEHPWNSGQANRWWEPLTESKRRAHEQVVRSCRSNGIQFCFAMNPNLMSPRPLAYDQPDDLDALWQHYAWMADLGVTWFSLCLDDISQGIDAAGQARVANELLRRLRSKKPGAELIFCPTRYWGTGDEPESRAYLDTLAATLHPDAYVFWTGPQVVGPTITKAQAERYRKRVKHRLVIWDNYPVNDGAPTLHLGPVTGRDRELSMVADGYMANPLAEQNEINRIPLLTMADYAYNPRGYDPARSIGQAIMHLGETPAQRQVLKDLVELYPGMLLTANGTGFNPVLARFDEVLETPQSRHLADGHLRRVEDVLTRMGREFPDRFTAARRTVESNLTAMRAAYVKNYAPE